MCLQLLLISIFIFVFAFLFYFLYYYYLFILFFLFLVYCNSFVLRSHTFYFQGTELCVGPDRNTNFFFWF